MGQTSLGVTLSLLAADRWVRMLGASGVVMAAISACALGSRSVFLSTDGCTVELQSHTIRLQWTSLAAAAVACTAACMMPLTTYRRAPGPMKTLTRDLASTGGVSLFVLFAFLVAATGAIPWRASTIESPMKWALSGTAVAAFLLPIVGSSATSPARSRLEAVCDMILGSLLGWSVSTAVPEGYVEAAFLGSVAVALGCFSLLGLRQNNAPPTRPAPGMLCRCYASYAGRAPAFVAAIALAVVAWRGINELRRDAFFCDGKVFTSVAWHAMQGSAPYREAWDHKPPGIYLLGVVAQHIWSPGIEAFRKLEQYNAALLALLVAGLALRITRSRAGALFAGAAVVALLYESSVICGGIYTTEFGVTACVAAVHAGLSATRADRFRKGWAFVCGVLFAASMLLKEPFLFSAVPWFLYVARNSAPHWRGRVPVVAWMLLGGCLTAGIALLWAIYAGVLSDWLDVLNYNAAYSKAGSEYLVTPESKWIRLAEACRKFVTSVVGLCPLLGALASCGVISAFDAGFNRLLRGIPRLLAAQLLLELVAVSLSGRLYLPYYHQLAPTYVLLAAVGGTWIAAALHHSLRRIPPLRPADRAAVSLLVTIFVTSLVPAAIASGDFFRSAWRRTALPAAASVPPSDVAQLISRTTDAADTIWVPNPYQAEVYVDARRRSATRYLYLSPWLLLERPTRTLSEIKRIIQSELTAARPAVVVLTPNMKRGLATLDIDGWFDANYVHYTSFPLRGVDHWPRVGLRFDAGFDDTVAVDVFYRRDKLPTAPP